MMCPGPRLAFRVSCGAVLDSVRLLRPSPGLATVRAYVARGGLRRYGMAQAWRIWPPPARVLRQLHAVKGFRVPPHTRRGVVSSPGILIRDHDGDHEHTLVDPLALRVSPASPCQNG